jgi:phosphatidylglycerol:prolipoprotein diacylglycerol transferase
MHPVLFEIHGFTLRTYSVMVLLGFVLSYAFAYSRKTAARLSEQEFDHLILWLFVWGLIGARVAYVVSSPHQFHSLYSVIAVWEGGISVIGMLLGGALYLYYFSRRFKKNFHELAAVIGTSLPLGIAVGRLGCWFNGCCYGREAPPPWGVKFPDLPYTVLPTQLYASALHILTFAVFLYLFDRKPEVRKSLGPLYLVVYGIERFFLEYLRWGETATVLWGKITVGQIACIGMILLGLLIMPRAGGRKEGDKGGRKKGRRTR